MVFSAVANTIGRFYIEGVAYIVVSDDVYPHPLPSRRYSVLPSTMSLVKDGFSSSIDKWTRPWHGDGLAPHDGPCFRCPHPHIWSEASSFYGRPFFLVACAPTSCWEEGMETSSWQEMRIWRSCQLKHLPALMSILLAPVTWWRLKYVLAVFAFLVFNSRSLTIFCVNLQKNMRFCVRVVLFLLASKMDIS